MFERFIWWALGWFVVLLLFEAIAFFIGYGPAIFLLIIAFLGKFGARR